MSRPGEDGNRVGLARVAATLSHFATGTGANSVTVVLDQGFEFSPVTVSLDAGSSTVTVTEGEEVRVVPAVSAAGEAEPIGRLHLHAFPPFDVEIETGSITGAIGGLDHLAGSVSKLAELFESDSAASAEYPTAAGGTLEIGANSRGEIALIVDGVEFEAPEGWPAL